MPRSMARPGWSPSRADLRLDRKHGERWAAMDGVLDELAIDGFRLEEAVLHHRPSHTLIAADLVHNIGAPSQLWTKVYAGAMGFYDRVGLSRVLRWAAFSDRGAARKSVDEVLTLPFERLVVGHGAPVVHDACDALRDAYAWLR